MIQSYLNNMETILTITFIIILILISKGAYHNYYVLNTFGYKSKKHELYLNKIFIETKKL